MLPRFRNKATWLLVFASAFLLGASILRSNDLLVNSDSAAAVLLAEELVKQQSPISPNWHYVSDDLQLDTKTLLAVIGVLIFGPNLSAMVFLAFTSAILCAASVYYLATTCGASRIHAALAALVVVAGPSVIYRDLVVTLAISSRIGLIAIAFASFTRSLYSSSRPASLAAGVLVCALLSISGPKQALAYIVIPVVSAVASFAVIGRFLTGTSSTRNQRSFRALTAIAAVWGIGSLIHQWLADRLLVNASYASLDVSIGNLESNLSTITDLLMRFAGCDIEFAPVAFPIVAIGLLATLLLVPLLIAGRAPSEFRDSPGAFVLIAGWCGLVTVGAYLLTYDRIKPYYGIYYAIIPVSIIVCAAAAQLSVSMRRGKLSTALSIALIGSVGVGAVSSAVIWLEFPPGYRGYAIKQLHTSRERQELIDWLRRRHLRLGYANFWEANAITVTSGGAVHVVPRAPGRAAQLSHWRWLVSSGSGERRPTNEAWFILDSSIRRRGIPSRCEPADAMSHVGLYRIYEFYGPREECFTPMLTEGRSAPPTL